MLRAHGLSEQECLDHSAAWLKDTAEALHKRRQEDFQVRHRQSLLDILIGVNLAVATAHGSEEAAERMRELMIELQRPPRAEGEEKPAEEMSDDEWLLNPKAKGYDLNKIKGQLAGMGASVQARS
jgi:hypothetical protein